MKRSIFEKLNNNFRSVIVYAIQASVWTVIGLGLGCFIFQINMDFIGFVKIAFMIFVIELAVCLIIHAI